MSTGSSRTGLPHVQWPAATEPYGSSASESRHSATSRWRRKSTSGSASPRREPSPSPPLGFSPSSTERLSPNHSFNRRAEDFTSLLAYNDYLEEVENITFNLLNSIDVATTEAKLAAHAAQNAASITRNTQLQRHESANQTARAEAEKEQARLRRDAARADEEAARREKHLGRNQVLDQLVQGSRKDAEEIAKRGQVRLKQSSARRQPFSTAAKPDLPTIDYTIAGLKSTSPPRGVDVSPSDNPYYMPPTPKGQSRYTYFSLPDKATIGLNPWLDKARTDPAITAGGYDVEEYCRRALVEAFAGMTTFIGEDDEGDGDAVAK